MLAEMSSARLLQRASAIVVAALGLLVIAGWVGHVRWLVLPPNNAVAMVPGTALSFLLSGLALLALGTQWPPRMGAVRLLAGALLAFQLVGLLVVFGTTPNLLDFGTGAGWLQDANPFPGRMAPNTRIGFLVSSLLLFSLARPVVSRRHGLPPLLISGLLMIAATGVISFFFQTDLLLPWEYARMALPTAAGMCGIALAGWGVWQQDAKAQPMSHADHLIRTAALITISLVIVAGFSGFASLGSFARVAVAEKLEQTLQSRSTMLEEQQRLPLAVAKAFAARPDIAEDADRIVMESSSPARARLEAALSEMIGSGFRGAAIIGPQGTILAHRGVLAVTPEIAATLDPQGRATVLWEGQFLLRATVPLSSSGNTLVLERAIPRFSSAWSSTAGLGDTGESVLCMEVGSSLHCFPSRHNQGVFRVAKTFNGHLLPMALALQGKAGTQVAVDYRGKQVVVSFRPISGGRLGMVVKQDADELAAPIRRAMLWMLPMLAGLVTAAIWLLKSKVNPLGLELERLESAARDAHAEIDAVLRGISDGLLIVDAQNRIVSVNRAATSMFGYREQDLLGRDLSLLIPPSMRAAHEVGMVRFNEGGEARVVGKGRLELRGLRSDGSEFPLELSVDAIPHAGAVRLVGSMRDITVRKQAEQAVAFERERLRVTLHSIGDGVITSDTAARVTYMNPVAETLTGWSANEALGRQVDEVFRIFHSHSDEPAPNPIDFVLSTGSIGGLAHDTMLLRRDGIRIAVEDSAAPIRDADLTLVGAVLVFHDVTQARAVADQMTHQASHDSLTDLINRREFERQLAVVLDGKGPQDKGHALLYLDMDQFKIVNDTAGHQAGDELLRQVTTVLKGGLRAHDELARLGGDEFAVLLRDCPVEPALRVAEVLRQAMADFRFLWQGQLFAVGVSIGVVHFNAGDSSAAVLSDADSACYIAKEQGRNRVYLHQHSDDDVVRRTGDMNWTTRIPAALAEGRFALYAQWIVPVQLDATGPPHCELLLRMLDESGELVPPMAFIPAAERYGLMPAIDRWVVEHAFAAMARARVGGSSDLQFSINLSGASLNDGDFLKFVEEQFAAAAIPFRSICFEITETAAIANLARAREVIDRLRSLGCQFSLDDFGTGLSSFSYLKSLRVDYLKIDGSFIRNVARDPIDRVMVDAINRVGHEMDLCTIAEFVESDEILAMLRSVGVDYAQGYGIAVPMPLDLALAMSHARSHIVRG
jgi:diguanylate cyclase (GGDEF)-like protein/PAS domain S-box-containing protein